MLSKKKFIKFVEQNNIDLPDTPVEMYRGIYLLEKENNQLADNHSQGSVLLILMDKKDNEQNRYLIHLPVEQKQKIEDIMTKLLIAPTVIKQENADKKTKLVKMKKIVVKTKPTIFFSFSDKHNKKFYILTFLLVLIGGTSFMFFNNHHFTSTDPPSYQELLKEKKYEEIFKKYPDKETEVVDKLYSKKDSKELEKLAKKENSQLALFYLAFLNEEWGKVTSIKGLDPTATLQAMCGYAFLKQGKLEEAVLINQEINNKTLAEQIVRFKKKTAYEALHRRNIDTAEKINKDINDSELADDIKVAKSIDNLLQKYSQDKDNTKLSDKDRKEAETNYNLWVKNLQKLGGSNNE